MADVVINVGAVSAITAGTGLTGGTITGTGTIAADFGTTAGTICQGNDARLTAPVAPLAHASTHTAAGSDALTLSQAQITNLGTDLAAKVAATRQVIAGTGMGGGGALSADVTLNVSYGTSGTTACVGNDARLSNARTPTTHASTHSAGQPDAITITQAQVTSLVSDLALKASTTHASTHATGGTDVLTLGQAQITGLTASLAAKALGATTMTAGTGLTGGGDLSANRSFAVAYGTTSTTATVGNDARLSFVASGTGATTRTLQNKLRDIISVKDFGATGDGSTDDTAAINTAIDAALAGSGNLYFPAGVYAMSSNLDLTANQAQIPLKTMTRDLNILGDQATIRCTRSTEVVYMMYFFTAGFDFSMSGITFDQNQKAWVGLRVEQNTGTSGTALNIVTIDNCTFENSYKTTTTLAGWGSNGGLFVSGGFKKVAITNCTVQNNSRAINTANPGNTSTLGIFIANSGTVPNSLFAQNIYVSGCLIQNILNDEVGISGGTNYNFDTDGMSVFGGFSQTSSYTPCRAIITNNTFVNCKGRSIKMQLDEVTVTNNTFRFGIRPCGNATLTNGGIVDAQGITSTITNNIWHYDPAPGNVNPFNANGTAGAIGNYCVTSFLQPDSNGPRPKSIIIENNTVYNNVTEAVGVLASFCDLSEDGSSQMTGANAQPGFVSVKGNRVLGGTVQDFAIIGLRIVDEGKMYVNMNDNHASKMSRSLIASGGGALFANNFITCIGNTNASGTDVAHLVNGSTGLVTYPAQITAMNNQGIGLLASKQGASDKSFLARVDGIAPSNPVDDANYGAFSIQTANVAANATHTFPRRYGNVEGATFLIIGNSIAGHTNAMFTIVGTGTIQTGWANTTALIAASGPPVLTASKLSIGRNPSGDNEVQIINGFTGSRNFTLYTFG